MRIEAWIEGAGADPSAGFIAGELVEHLRAEIRTFSWVLDAIPDKFGFEVLDRSFVRSAYGEYPGVRRA